MADAKISQLTRITNAEIDGADLVTVVDTDAVETKGMSFTELGNRFASAGHNHSGTYAPLVHTHAASDITAGTLADARISQSNVTQHQAAITITTSQISDFGSYLEDISGEPIGDLSDVTVADLADGEVLVSSGGVWINRTLAEAGIAAAAHAHAASDVNSGTFADARIAESNVTQHEGALSITESQISDFATYVKADGTVAFTGNQAMGNNRLTGLATPAADTDAATKAYVDAAIAGLAWKESVVAATTAAGTLATDFENGDSIDGVALATGDRILIKNQSTATQNGIYTVNASGAPTRAGDLEAGDGAAGVAVFVEQGTTNADNGFVCTNNAGGDVVGTDNLTFAQFTGTGGGESNTASNVGTGQGVFKQKTGFDLEFYEIAAGSSKISVSLVSDDVTIDLGTVSINDLSNVTLSSIGDDEILVWSSGSFINRTYAEAGVSVVGHTHDHGTITGLSDDDHTQYVLLAGRSGGQAIIGGTASGNNLTLASTAHATKGKVESIDQHQFDKSAHFGTEVDNGNSGTSDTVDWTAGNKQRSTLTGNCEIAFTAPPGACNLILKLIQDGTGSRTVTWPASVKWPGGTPPTLTTDADAIDIVAFYYDGTNYYGQAALDFS